MAEAPPVAISLAILYDPVKLENAEEGYPSPALTNVLAMNADISVTVITVASLLDGVLSRHTCLCIPGGFAHNYASRLGEHGQRIIQDFVAGGGGYVGLCAGAYLGSAQGLNLLPVDCVDVHRWARGTGPCQLRFTWMGHHVLGAASPFDGTTGEPNAPVTVRYANGPLLHICDEDAAQSLATFATEFRDELHAGHRFGSRLEGSPAVVVGRCKSRGGSNGSTSNQGSSSGGGDSMLGGVVALASPHLEDGADARALLPFVNMFRLASRGSFYQRWVESTRGRVGARDHGAPASELEDHLGEGVIEELPRTS